MMYLRRTFSCLAILGAVASCTSREPIGLGEDKDTQTAAARASSVTPADPEDRVNVRFTIDGAAAGSLTQLVSFQLERLPDGISIERITPQASPGADARFAGNVLVPEMVSAARVTLSSGAEFFGPRHTPAQIDERQTARLREALGIPAPAPIAPQTQPHARVPAARVPRIITPEVSSMLLANLRASGAREERIGQREIRFHLSSDIAQQAIIFDESVGAVTERHIERTGKPTIHVRNTYKAVVGGFVLATSTSEWTDAEGVTERTSVKTYVQ